MSVLPDSNVIHSVKYCFKLAVLLFIFHSCKTVHPIAPVKEVFTSHQVIPISEINIPIEVSTIETQKLINNRIKGLLYEDNDLENNNRDNLLLKVWKKDLIIIEPAGDEIFYKVPLKIWAKVGFEFKNFGLNFSQFKEIESALILKFKSKPEIDSNFNIIFNTSPDGFEWETKPVIKFGIFEFPLVGFVDNILKNEQLKLARELDQQARKSFNLKNLLESAWVAIQKPIQISADPEVWSFVQPIDILISPIQGNSEKIKTVVSINAFFKGITGMIPQQNLSPFPDLKKSLIPEDTSFVNFSCQVSYAEINNFLRKNVVGKNFKYKKGRKTIIINNVDVYPAQNNLVFKIGIEGNVEGNIYIEGIPFYNPSSQSIKLRNTDFALDTKNILLKTSSWLVHSSFTKEIEDNLVFPISEYLSQFEEIVNKNLNYRRITNNFLLQGHLIDIVPQDLTLMQDSVSFSLNARSILKGSIDGLNK